MYDKLTDISYSHNKNHKQLDKLLKWNIRKNDSVYENNTEIRIFFKKERWFFTNGCPYTFHFKFCVCSRVFLFRGSIKKTYFPSMLLIIYTRRRLCCLHAISGLLLIAMKTNVVLIVILKEHISAHILSQYKMMYKYVVKLYEYKII